MENEEKNTETVEVEIKEETYDAKKDAEDNKVMGVLAYIWILWLVPLLAAPNSKFARYHANQGIILFIFDIVCAIVGTLLGLIPYVGWIFNLLTWVAQIVFIVMGIINAVNGECKPLPLIGDKITILK